MQEGWCRNLQKLKTKTKQNKTQSLPGAQMSEPSPLTSIYHTFSHDPCLLPCPHSFSPVPTPPVLSFLCFQLLSSCFQPHSRTSSSSHPPSIPVPSAFWVKASLLPVISSWSYHVTCLTPTLSWKHSALRCVLNVLPESHTPAPPLWTGSPM